MGQKQGELFVQDYTVDCDNFLSVVRIVPHFYQYIYIYVAILPIVQATTNKCIVRIYCFVDTSESDFCSTMLVKKQIHCSIENWSRKDGMNYFNCREIESLVYEMGHTSRRKGWLNSCTLILIIYNRVVEASI